MSFDATFFPINDTRIAWGSTLAEAEAQLPGQAWQEPYGGWPNLRGTCAAALGLAATEFNLRAPARHKPVLQVGYELAPPRLSFWPWRRPAYWMEPLTDLLGPPINAQAHHESWNRRPGGVAYTAHWKVAMVRVSLSVFGGVREREGVATAAGLSLDWEDEITAAKPFHEAAQIQAAFLEAGAGQAEPRRFATLAPQTGYQMPQHGESLLHPAPVADSRRQSQRALYQEGLYETPARLQALLGTKEAALWAVAGAGIWAVSTRWDTVLLGPDSPHISLVTMRPAKGRGGITLSVGDLTLRDTYGSAALSALAAAIEQQTSLSVSRVEGDDC